MVTMGSKLNHAILSAAIILISLGVSVIRAKPGSLKSIVPGLVLIAVGICLAIIWKKYFEKEILEKASPLGEG